MIIGETPYFSKDMSVVWIKNVKGEIKTYELTEIVPKDDKDILIESLQMQIEDLRKEIKENAKPINDDVNESNKNEESTSVPVHRTSTKKSK
jgi:phosphoribosylaminoimidazole carboxylase (NCAIR synthetase)